MARRRRILVCFGTRPEILKLFPVIRALKADRRFVARTCFTGQHRKMVADMLKLFGLQPDLDLAVMTPDQTLPKLTRRLFQEGLRVFERERPDMILVQGDTTSAALMALLGYYEKIPVGHVEAGLRTGDKHQPFPEEMNRRLIGQIADLHFAPTRLARANLLGEGVRRLSITVTGNTGIDTLNAMLCANGSVLAPRGVKLDPSRRLVLVTAHRRENLGRPLASICRALARLVRRFPDIEIVYPVHLNPRVRATVHRVLAGCDRVRLVEPVDYAKLVALMRLACLILTDSGGIQEEAPYLGKPVLILRNVTERPEGVWAGAAKLVGTREEAVFQEACRLLASPAAYRRMARRRALYGDGRAAARIVKRMRAFFA